MFVSGQFSITRWSIKRLPDTVVEKLQGGITRKLRFWGGQGMVENPIWCKVQPRMDVVVGSLNVTVKLNTCTPAE